MPGGTHMKSGAFRAESRAGFTIIELLVTLLILAILAGLLITAGTAAVRYARTSADRQSMAALKQGVEQFRQDTGFLPPLIMDTDGANVGSFPDHPSYNDNALSPARPRSAVFDFNLVATNASMRDYLRGWKGGARVTTTGNANDADLRFSNYSLATYLLGKADVLYTADGETQSMDGIKGPGMLMPAKDGTFATPGTQSGRAGKRLGEKFSIAGGFTVVDVDLARGAPSEGRVEIRSRQGTPVRFYRWLRGDRLLTTEVTSVNGQFNPALLNVPELLGDPAESPELRSADFGIVAAGPDGVFGDVGTEAPARGQAFIDLCLRLGIPINSTDLSLHSKARADNIVEVGK